MNKFENPINKIKSEQKETIKKRDLRLLMSAVAYTKDANGEPGKGCLNCIKFFDYPDGYTGPSLRNIGNGYRSATNYEIRRIAKAIEKLGLTLEEVNEILAERGRNFSIHSMPPTAQPHFFGGYISGTGTTEWSYSFGGECLIASELVEVVKEALIRKGEEWFISEDKEDGPGWGSGFHF